MYDLSRAFILFPTYYLLLTFYYSLFISTPTDFLSPDALPFSLYESGVGGNSVGTRDGVIVKEGVGVTLGVGGSPTTVKNPLM